MTFLLSQWLNWQIDEQNSWWLIVFNQIINLVVAAQIFFFDDNDESMRSQNTKREEYSLNVSQRNGTTAAAWSLSDLYNCWDFDTDPRTALSQWISSRLLTYVCYVARVRTSSFPYFSSSFTQTQKHTQHGGISVWFSRLNAVISDSFHYLFSFVTGPVTRTLAACLRWPRSILQYQGLKIIIVFFCESSVALVL